MPTIGFAGDLDDAVVGILEAGDEAQRRRLAAAAGPEQRDRLAGADAEAHIVDRGRSRRTRLMTLRNSMTVSGMGTVRL